MNRVREIHPCFGAKKNTGRIHLPVSPDCNIFCKFCNRQINSYENRPGVSSTIISPIEAIDIVKRAIELCPEITVIGIAGPGDTLATNHAIQTFQLVKEKFPYLIKCMSTNGLLLPEKSKEILDLGIESLTVTVNAINPKILTELCSGIIYERRMLTGEEGAKILIANQLEGIKKIAREGVTVKVNTVLVPEINGSHISEISKAVREAGAEIYNIIPLIPQHKLSSCKQPSCIEIEDARKNASEYIDVFRHCQRCRADAIGVPGKSDFADKIYPRRLDVQDTFSHG